MKSLAEKDLQLFKFGIGCLLQVWRAVALDCESIKETLNMANPDWVRILILEIVAHAQYRYCTGGLECETSAGQSQSQL